MSRKRYPSDAPHPRCNVCRQRLALVVLGNRCPHHPIPYSKDYDAFLTLPVPEGGATHAEIAAVMGISAERVRQIEASALRKLGLDPRALALFRGE